MSNFENYSQICNEILKINDHIRFAGIIDKKLFISKQRNGLKKLLTDTETEESISNIIIKWEERKQLISKLGNGIFSMAVYSKIIRMSTPINENGLLLVSIDPTESYQEIISKILKFKTDSFSI